MPLNPDQIKALIAQTKAKLKEKHQTGPAPKPKQLSEREKRREETLNSAKQAAKKSAAIAAAIPETKTAAFNAPVLIPSGPISFSGNALSALQAKVQAQVAALRARGGQPGIGGVTGAPGLPNLGRKKVIGLKLDSQGRVVDASGNVLHFQKHQSEFVVNARASRQEQLSKVAKLAESEEERLQASQFYDTRLEKEVIADRKKRALKFHVPGSHVERAEKLRTKEKLERLQSEISKAARQTGLSAATKIALTVPKKEELINNDVPDVEWWDSAIVGPKGYEEGIKDQSKLNDVTSLVQHPITFEPPGRKRATLPVYITKKERAKIRRQRRRAMQEEKQEKIRLGLEEPPPPKVKISNLMRVLGQEAIQDPTKVEALVREQMQLRQQQHDEHNAARTLTPAQKAAKKARKLHDDTSRGVHAIVFLIKSLKNEKNKWKVETNAKQYNLTGCAIMTDNHNVLVVEGGPKNIRKYKRLLLHRMKWNEKGLDLEDDVMDEDDDELDLGTGDEFCKLVWEVVLQNQEHDFTCKGCP